MENSNGMQNLPLWAVLVLRVRRALLWALIAGIIGVCLALTVVLILLLFHTTQTPLR